MGVSGQLQAPDSNFSYYFVGLRNVIIYFEKHQCWKTKRPTKCFGLEEMKRQILDNA
jgi:hypothetical protein